MKLDKFKILSEADAKFGSSRSGKVSIKLSEKCYDIIGAKECFSDSLECIQLFYLLPN